MLAILVAALLAQDSSSGSPSSPPAPAMPPPSAPPNTYRALFASSPLILDGKLDDAAWNLVPWTADFVDIEGPAKPTPRYRTRAKMLWDERYLYVAAELEEPDVWATLRAHDEIVFHDNDFEIFIDPDGDGRAYYELETNCLGTIFDLFLPRTYRDGGPAVHTWDCVRLVTKIAVQGSVNDPRDDDKGWTLEWAIPWASLIAPSKGDQKTDDKPLPPVVEERQRNGAAPKDGEMWRINFSRVQWKHNFEELDEKGARVGPKNRSPVPLPDNNAITQSPLKRYEKKKGESEGNWVWSPQWVVDMHVPDRWGKVTFVRDVAK